LKTIARGTPGFSGADLANLVNEAALLAARKNKRIVTKSEFEEARDKVMMGAERKSKVISEDDKKITAYHEAGHAIVSLNEKACDPIHKATIIPRGIAGGMVMPLPERDRDYHSKEYFHSIIAMAMGGRVSEEIILGHDKVTTGAMQDIKQATSTARRMVTRFGMSSELGPLTYGDNEDEVFLGRSITRHQQMSEDTARKIDIEIKKIVDTGYKKAKKILTEKIDDLHKLAKALMLYETLTGDEIKDLIFNNKTPERGEDLKEDKNKETSALGSFGLKPKHAH
jgi:cell division protease FtsH